jgi:succinate dehydrogenase / fumarate reductase cytochrome b subunit
MVSDDPDESEPVEDHDDEVVDDVGLDDVGHDDGDHEDDGDDQAAPHEPLATSSRWARLGGAVALAYVVWYLVDLVVFDRRPSAFNAAHRLYGNPAMRVLFALVFLGMVFHGLNGLRVALLDVAPKLARRDDVLRAAVRFLTFATWIPASLALCWPSIRDWIAR